MANDCFVITHNVSINDIKCVYLERGRLKWWLANEQCEHDAAECPDVHFVGMALLGQHLRCDVVGCATQSYKNSE